MKRIVMVSLQVRSELKRDKAAADSCAMMTAVSWRLHPNEALPGARHY